MIKFRTRLSHAPPPSLLHTQSLRADNKDQGLQPGWMRIWGVGGSPPKTTNRQKFPALLRHVSIGALQQIVNNLVSFPSHAAWTSIDEDEAILF